MLPQFSSNFSAPNFANLNALRNMGGGFGSNPPGRVLPPPVSPGGGVWGGQPPVVGPYPVSPISPGPQPVGPQPVGPSPVGPAPFQPIQGYPVPPGFGANPPNRILPANQPVPMQGQQPGGFDMNHLRQLLALRSMMQQQAY